MSVYIIRKPDLLHKLITETIEDLWKNTTVSEIVDVGNQKRINYTVNGQPATLDIYQTKEGYTTFKATGKNIDLTKQLILELEKKGYPITNDVKTYSMFIGSDWAKKAVDYLIQLTTKENYGFYESKENNGNTIHSYISSIGDKLTLTVCPDGKILIQGKPLYLYNELLSFVSQSPNVKIDDVVAATKAFVTNRVTDAVSARSKMAALMPKAYGGGIIDDTIWKVYSPSMALIDVNAEMEDYSCVMFPALRALEGYLQFLLAEIGEVIDRHHKIADIFQEDNTNPGHFVMVKRTTISKVNQKDPQYRTALEEVFTYFTTHRHVSFHMSQIFIDTKVITNKQEAIDTVNEVAALIEKTFVATHP